MSEPSSLIKLALLLSNVPGFSGLALLPGVLDYAFSSRLAESSRRRGGGTTGHQPASPDRGASKVSEPARAQPFLYSLPEENCDLSRSGDTVETPAVTPAWPLSDTSEPQATAAAVDAVNAAPAEEASNGVTDQAFPAHLGGKPTSVRREKAKATARGSSRPALLADSSSHPPSPPPEMSAAKAALTDQATRLIRKSEVCGIVGFGPSKLAYLLNEKHKYYDPTFPKPFKSKGSRICMWYLHEVLAWVQARADLRGA